MNYPNHIARERTKWSLTQDDLAILLDTSRRNVSRIELLEYNVSVERAFMLEALFGVSTSALFAPLYTASLDTLARRVAALDLMLANNGSPEAERKRELLTDFAHRAPATDLAV